MVKARFLLVFALLLVHPSVSAQTPVTIRELQIKPTTTTSPDKNEEINPLRLNQSATYVEKLDKNLTIFFLFTVKALTVSLTAFLGILVIYRIRSLIVNSCPRLIIDNFKNATGEEKLDGVLPGLRQLARENLIEEIKSVQDKVKNETIVLEIQTYHLIHKPPLPETVDKQTQNSAVDEQTKKLLAPKLTNLIDSLQKFTPDQIDLILQLLKVIFPPRGTIVTSILQSRGDFHHELGITFEIIDLKGDVPSEIFTRWEFAENQLSEQKSNLKDRYHELLKSATKSLARKLSERIAKYDSPEIKRLHELVLTNTPDAKTRGRGDARTHRCTEVERI